MLRPALLKTCLISTFSFSIFLFSACATHVEISGTFPRPLSKKYPFSATLVLNEDFRNYRFENSEPKELSIAVGSTQVQLFEAVSNSLFQNINISHSIPENPLNDLILVPTVSDVQIAMPYETQLKVFEVWIKYKLELFDQKGELISTWTMPAYGKTPTRFLKSESEALNQATIVALRDAGANLITGFENIPEVRAWLTIRAPEATTSKS